MRLLPTIFFVLFLSSKINAQKITKNNNAQTSNISVLWDNLDFKSQKQIIKFESPVPFSTFAFGVKTNNSVCKDFIAEYRLFINNKWTDWKQGDFDYTAADSKTGMFWSELFFTPTQKLRTNIEFRILSDKNITKIRIDAYDVISDKIKHQINNNENSIKSTNECPSIPSIKGREIWLHPYYGTQSYTPTPINADHVVIHHGASPDTYSDGAAVVRSYWNYHVNTHGWSDIGYNYLTDKYGNLFQGRKNSNIVGQDVRGAHAGSANSESIGINFVGNLDIINPTAVQLQTCNQFLAWWFNIREYNPTESDNMTTQNSGILSIPRISGHRDVNIGGTSCPGNALYNELPNIRLNTQAIIDQCSGFAETEVNSENNWKTQDFTSNFIDTATNGIKQKYYQVIDFDGASWSANTDYGFFADNFGTLNSNWTQHIGTWSANNNFLNQTDETNSNTSLSAELNQNNSNAFLYNFTAMIGGTGNNKRAGLHFMCSESDLTNRGNSYMVYYRTDYARVEIYKTENDVLLPVKVMENYTMQDNIYYDFKITYSKSSGEIVVYIDNQKITSWIDASPYQNGDYISFRTGNCTLRTSEIKVYHSRGLSENITLGNNTKEIRFQNPSPSVFSAKVKSIIVDNNDLLSSIYYHNLNIDWTAPNISYVNDGLSTDVDNFNTETSISANWGDFEDINSEIMQYWYSVGTTSGANNVIDWTATTNNNFTANSLNLTNQQMYYVNVKAENNAGLISNIASTDGQLLVISNIINEFENNLLIYPNPTKKYIVIKSNMLNETYEIYNSLGKKLASGTITSNTQIIDIANLYKGTYFIKIKDKGIVREIIKL